MITEKKNKDGIVVWKINKPQKIYEYCFMQDCSQRKSIKQLIFIGYTKQPSSLNSNGYGFMRALKPFYFQLK